MNAYRGVVAPQGDGEPAERPVAGADARPRPGLVVAAAAFATLLATLQQTLLIAALPALPGVLGASASAVSWAVTATLLAGSIATPVVARLAELHGTRRLALIILAVVVVGSAIAPIGGLAPLIVGRALQGLGTAFIPLGIVMLQENLDRALITRAMAVLGATLGVGGSLGIPLGGVLLDQFGWRSIFLVSGVGALLAWVLLRVAVPHRAGRVESGRFDLAGAVALSVALTLLLLNIERGQEWGWLSPLTVGSFALGLVALIVWIRTSWVRTDPLIDLQSAMRWPVLLTNVAGVMMGIGMFTNLLGTTAQLQNSPDQGGFDGSATMAGAIILPSAVCIMLITPVMSKIASSLGPRALLLIGAVVLLASFLVRSVFTPSIALLVTYTTVAAMGTAMTYTSMPMLLGRYADRAHMAEANGLNALVRAIGTTIGSAVFAAVTTGLRTTGPRPEPTAGALAAVYLIGAAVSVVTILAALGIGRAPRR